jgi:hypothetical protein
MLMDLISPLKDTICQDGLKRKNRKYIVYRRPISLTETRTLWKKIYQNYGLQKHARVAMCILDKVDFKLTLIK